RARARRRCWPKCRRRKGNTMALKIGVVGAGGRMGQTVIRAVTAHGGMTLAAAADRDNSSVLGKDAGSLVGLEPLGVVIGDTPLDIVDQVDAVLDFTAPQLSVALARRAAERKLIHIIGTT